MGSVELTPFLTVKDARGVVEFYKKAFGAIELSLRYGVTGRPEHLYRWADSAPV